jgi:hypothetical protein
MSDVAVVNGIEYNYFVRNNGKKDYIAVYQSGYPNTLFLAVNIDHIAQEASIDALDCSFDAEYKSMFTERCMTDYYSKVVKDAIQLAELV